ncbi:MATE family efflux transporter [Halobacterium sp. KA-6]|uniref:MATE family efflux transporter n=1 Tax=Halobacterium sp. KA-6 TaxID=2896368 RepID=UPI001E5C1602|nr:MATE family efflux transporter [Halobacterium sp. KA-6]MCD2203227.1 MATE family efflux transporter [Halobacterium sp. KA-6]
MFDVSREEITDGPLSRALFYVAAPLVVQQYVVVLQQVVDAFWLGRVSEEAVAAVGLVAPVVALLCLGANVAFTGAQVLVAQHAGAEKDGAARRAAFHAVLVALAFNLAALAFAAVFATDILALFDPGAVVVELGALYLVVVLGGMVFGGMSDAIEGAFVGWGDSRAALVVNVVVVAVNVVLDPFLVVGWGIAGFAGYGILGAALGTAGGYVAGFGVAVALATTEFTGFAYTRETMRLRLDSLRDVLEVGVPKAGQEGGRQTARLLMVAIVSGVGGSAGLAAYTVGMRISTLAFVPAIAVGSAVASVVGQNLGAERPARATRATWLAAGVATVALALVGVLQFAIPGLLADVFAPSLDGDALTYTVAYLQILAVGYWTFGVIYPVQGGFNGAGKTQVSMVATMLQYWVVRLPIAVVGAYVVVLSVPVYAAFWAITLSNVAAAVGVTAYFYYSTDRGLLERVASSMAADAAD